MFLSPEDLKQLTGKIRRPSQAAVLNQMGIRFKLRPDGFPIVSISHISKELDGWGESVKKREEPNWNAL